MKLFSTEQVSKYHPDKMADQVSDAIVTACLKVDKEAHVGCEVLLKGSVCVIAGEITTKVPVNVERIAIKKLYELEPGKDYTIVNLISEQSPEINRAVRQDDKIGAGDQGMMFGYATRETESRLPYGFDLANRVIKIIERDVAVPGSILKGDAKCQVTVDLDKKGLDSVEIILVSVCHEEGYTLEQVQDYVKKLLPEYVDKLWINPSGTWTIGGPDADAGVTGRKIVCDQYGGYVPVGGGAFSGRDPTKVDRSASYMARQIAIELLEEFELEWCEVQLAYAIGVAEPVSIAVTSDKPQLDLAQEVKIRYDLTPRGMIDYLNLLHINFAKLAAGCHYYRETGAC